VTTTLNGGYGSKVVVQGAGFFMNNEMDDFSIKPGVPNMYGVIGGKANAIAPYKRMLSSMTPSIVEKNNKLLMVVGTPGGSTIITSVFQTILNVIEHGMTMQEAVSAKRFHHQWTPDAIIAEENAFSETTNASLEKKGHTINVVKGIGRVDAILIKKKRKEGGADPRGDDTAIGY
ncbi:MAG: gamma-glutamyltransferase, partial [Verrucomicrobia bacterium]|nr:gamma-glutamyltransferase [Cytophagales bacterium]